MCQLIVIGMEIEPLADGNIKLGFVGFLLFLSTFRSAGQFFLVTFGSAQGFHFYLGFLNYFGRGPYALRYAAPTLLDLNAPKFSGSSHTPCYTRVAGR